MWNLSILCLLIVYKYHIRSPEQGCQPPTSSNGADLATERERYLTTGKRAEKTKHDFRCPICPSYLFPLCQHRSKTSTYAPDWAFPVSFSVTLSSQMKVSRALSASFCVELGLQLVVQLFCFMLLVFLTILYLFKLLLWITRHRSLKQLVD